MYESTTQNEKELDREGLLLEIRHNINTTYNNLGQVYGQAHEVRTEFMPQFLAAVEQLKLTVDELMRGIEQSRLTDAVEEAPETVR